MAVPGFQSFLRPVLDQYADGAEGRARDLSDVVAARLQLSACDLEETIPSGEPRFLNRMYWAHSYLKQAGLLESPRRGMYRMSPLGHQVNNPLHEQINIQWLEQFPTFQDFRARSHSASPEESATDTPPQISSEELTPDERRVESENRVRQLHPADMKRPVKYLTPLSRTTIHFLRRYGGKSAANSGGIAKARRKSGPSSSATRE